MRRVGLLAALLATACRGELKPEERAQIEGWVAQYVKADLRAQETMTHATGEHVKSIRERDEAERNLVQASEDRVLAQGVREAIQGMAQSLDQRERDATSEKNSINIQGRALTDKELKRLDELEAELRRVAAMKTSLAQLTTRAVPRRPDPPPPKPLPRPDKY
jgi:hypothetical protein